MQTTGSDKRERAEADAQAPDGKRARAPERLVAVGLFHVGDQRVETSVVKVSQLGSLLRKVCDRIPDGEYRAWAFSSDTEELCEEWTELEEVIEAFKLDADRFPDEIAEMAVDEIEAAARTEVGGPPEGVLVASITYTYCCI